METRELLGIKRELIGIKMRLRQRKHADACSQMCMKEKNKNDGGQGSGNFGHSGRPGEVGGSAPDNGGGQNTGTNTPKVGEVVSGKNGNLKPKSDKARKIDTKDAVKEIKDGAHNSLEKYMDENGNLSPERQAVHDEIIGKFFKDKVPYEGKATMIMAGGGPASGKSFISRTANEEFGKDTVVKIDPDDFKAMLPGYTDMAEKDDGAAGYYHEESSALAKRAYQYACDNNINVVYDGTGDGSENSVASKIRTARDAGYDVVGRYVTVDIPAAMERNLQRYLGAKKEWDAMTPEQKKKAKENGITVPRKPADSIVVNTHIAVSNIAPKVAGMFDKWELYDNNGPKGSKPVKIASCTKGGIIKVERGRDAEYQKFLDKGKEQKLGKGQKYGSR